jgi:lipopolysaccharide transport system ATP-binding protein
VSTVIKVENLGKKYTIRHQQSERYIALRDVMARSFKNVGGKLFSPFTGRHSSSADSKEDFWALKDVSFEIKEGKRVGIIGRNGAGKTTALKLLSRITEPTTGRIEITGRVASLLEVGTGFHPELTGRENIFLNGAILGMTRAEIKKKFDEIVDFAEIEKFLDTPVKRYSSGMYVRLAFAVAAHLEPKILIVDEVLAVGDAQFQKKCLGKMEEVGKEGRTVLFVSHNMGAVLSLCNHAILLDKGELLLEGAVSMVVDQYMGARVKQENLLNLEKLRRVGEYRAKASLINVTLLNQNKVGAWQLPFGTDIELGIGVKVSGQLPMLELGIALKTLTGFEIASSLSSSVLPVMSFKTGEYYFRSHFCDLTLTPGIYRFGLGLRSDKGFEDHLPDAFELEILVSDATTVLNAHKVLGTIIPKVHFGVVQMNGVREKST